MARSETSPRLSGAPARRGPGWWLVALALIAAVTAAPAAGFAWYVSQVPDREVALNRNADGIVALTGGRERIGEALELLAAGRGRRLLITGVNRTTRLEELARLVPNHEAMFACCVDLDRSAVNTIGNAVETRRWAHGHGFRSLVVVTSSYHMPRALAELAHQLPGVALLPFPVITERQRAAPWWASAAAARLMLAEYAKYVAALLRMQLDPSPRATELAARKI